MGSILHVQTQNFASQQNGEALNEVKRAKPIETALAIET
jgi:hypothetical protein